MHYGSVVVASDCLTVDILTRKLNGLEYAGPDNLYVRTPGK